MLKLSTSQNKIVFKQFMETALRKTSACFHNAFAPKLTYLSMLFFPWAFQVASYLEIPIWQGDYIWHQPCPYTMTDSFTSRCRGRPSPPGKSRSQRELAWPTLCSQRAALREQSFVLFPMLSLPKWQPKHAIASLLWRISVQFAFMMNWRTPLHPEVMTASSNAVLAKDFLCL